MFFRWWELFRERHGWLVFCRWTRLQRWFQRASLAKVWWVELECFFYLFKFVICYFIVGACGDGKHLKKPFYFFLNNSIFINFCFKKYFFTSLHVWCHTIEWCLVKHHRQRSQHECEFGCTSKQCVANQLSSNRCRLLEKQCRDTNVHSHFYPLFHNSLEQETIFIFFYKKLNNFFSAITDNILVNWLY